MLQRKSLCVESLRNGPTRPETFLLEERESGWMAYPVGLKEIAIGEGSNPTEALDSAKQELERHIQRVGKNVFGIK